MAATRPRTAPQSPPWRTSNLLTVVFVLLLLCGAAYASQANSDNPARRKRWSPEEFPNPQRDTSKCGRPHGVKSSICDPELILTTEQQNMVDGLINEIAAGTSPFKQAACGAAGEQGFQVAVAVFHRMSTRKHHGDKAFAAQHFARALHDDWGVGNPDCQNGALLLLAVGDREAYISTGAGVKALVSDSQLLGVLDAIKPALKHKRYAEAILSCVQQLGLLMSGQQPEPGGVDEDDGLGIFLFFAASVAAVMGWAWLSNRKRSKRYKTCADKLAAIKRDQAAIRSQQYAASSCPICLEDFDTPLSAAGAAAAARAAAAAAPHTGVAAAPAPPSPSAPPTPAAAAAGGGVGGGSGGGPVRRAAAAAAAASSATTDEEEADGADGGASAPLLGGAGAGAGAGPSSSRAGQQEDAAAGGGGAGAAGAPGSASKGKRGGRSEAQSEGRKALVLRCGHAFCDPCITKWLENHTSCPICRKDLDAPDGDQQAASSSSRDGRQQQQSQPQQQPQQPGGDASGSDGASCSRGAGGPQPRQEDLLRRQVWLPELGFRLRRLRMMYPDFVTDPMLYAWEEDLAADRELDTSAIAVFDPARQQQLEEGGRGGASTFASFGGGNSGGGGGAGSSW